MSDQKKNHENLPARTAPAPNPDDVLRRMLSTPPPKRETMRKQKKKSAKKG
jgi:hypothetical protein